MLFYKCNRSTFCILFLACFGFGVVLGVLLFQCLANSRGIWIDTYCKTLISTAKPSIFFICRPLMIVTLLILLPCGYRLVPLLIIARGFFISYSMSALVVSAVAPTHLIFRSALLLPVFYFLCYWAYFASERRNARSQ